MRNSLLIYLKITFILPTGRTRDSIGMVTISELLC